MELQMLKHKASLTPE
jgi:D-hexose-6-phosphate mutarotase